jgi:flagellar hook assembly protein FlgD
VKRILTAELSAGTHRYDWDGADSDSKPVPPGVYLYQLEAGGRKVTGKVLLLR